jgi:hypothetical protein
MYAIVSFDVEDVYYPPHYRIDDVPGWLAEIMTDCDVRGTFLVMGEKARSLRDRGRADVVEKMARHSIGSHQQGNIHPFIPEILQDKGWDDGVEAMREFEHRVTEEHVATFGREPVSLSRHNLYFGPQHVALAGRRGIPYMYNVPRIKEYDQPTWYAGALTFPHGGTKATIPTELDTVYSRDEIFQARLNRIDETVRDRVEGGLEYVTFFAGHPVRVMTRGWQEFHLLPAGKTRTPQQLGWLYGVKSREEEARAKANFRRFMEYLHSHPDIEVIGVEEAMQLFSTQPSHIRRDVLTLYAEAFRQAGRPIFHCTFSPAELVCGLAESLIHADEHGDLPSQVDRRDVLGPKSRPAIGVECDELAHAQMVELCRQLVAHVKEEGALPANLYASESRVGIGQFALVLARGYEAEARYEQYGKLRVFETPRYPDAAFELDTWIRRAIGEHWAMPLDFSCDRMAEQARLQTWSMKPAWLRPPQGPADLTPWHEGERILL